MLQFLVARTVQIPIVLLGVSVLAFGMLHLSGDPVHYMLGSDATADQIQQMRSEFGLDRPLYTQLVRFLRQLAVGNLGVSVRFRQPALGLVMDRLPATLTLTLVAMAIAVVTAIPLGVVAAMRPGTAYDHALMASTLALEKPHVVAS